MPAFDNFGDILPAVPADSDQESSVADVIRKFKTSIQAPLQAEHSNYGIHSKLTLLTHETKSVDYEILAGDIGKCFVSNNSSPITFTLPAAISVASGKYIAFRKISATSTVTIEANSGSDYVNGGASIVISEQYAMVILVSDGVNDWSVADVTAKAATTTETRLMKTAGQSVTQSTTMTADDTLLFAIGASEKYIFEIMLFYTCTLGQPYGIRFDFTSPSGATGYFTYQAGPHRNHNSGFHLNNGFGAIVASADPNNVMGCVLALATGVGGTYANLVDPANWVKITGSVINSTTAGNITLRWAQLTASGTALEVNAGSFLVARRV